MIYLVHPSGAIEVCEHEASAARQIARGFVRVSPELHKAYWRRKDRRALAEMAQKAAQAAPVLQERTVGGVPGLPAGYVTQYT